VGERVGVVVALLERVGLPGHRYSSGVGVGERVGVTVALLESRVTRPSLLQRGRVGERVGVVVALLESRVTRPSLLQRGRVGREGRGGSSPTRE
jgi:hypothetical protein